MQNFLRKIMLFIGNLLQRVMGLFAKSKASSGTNRSTPREEEADLRLHDLSEQEIFQLVQIVERLECSNLLPNLADKKILYITPNEPHYLPLITSKGGTDIYKVDVSRGEISQHCKEEAAWTRGSIESLPFKENSFHFAFYASALTWRSDLVQLIPEASRALADGGRLIITCVHPCFEFINAPKLGYQRSIENLYSALRKSGVFVEEFREGTMEEALKFVQFNPKRMKQLRNLKKLPMVLALRGLKIRQRKA